MDKKRVLFICRHNSARSQMAEEYLRSLGGEVFEAHSAGLEPTRVNPLVAEAMAEEGFNLSQNRTRSVFDLFRAGNLFEYVITVCSPEVEDKCPLFPGVTKRLNWPFPDPAAAEGSHEEQLEAVRKIRDDIKAKIGEFLAASGS